MKDQEKKHDFIASLKFSLNDPSFHSRIFSWVTINRKISDSRDSSDIIRSICAEEYDEISHRLDHTHIQDSTSVRNILRTRRLANFIINDKGDLRVDLLPKVIQQLKTNLYFLGPDRQFDSKRQEQILFVLNSLNEKKHLVRMLKNITRPFSHKFADQIIRDTLQLSENTVVTDAHTRRAVLTAWMCYLRQNVGSCFATAPAILIHDEQPEQFLTDLNELLSTGRLKRTYEGVEYSVPLSTSWGGGDLRRMIIASKDDQGDIWLSPGINSALTAIGLIDANLSLKEETEETKRIIINLLDSFNQSEAYMSVENLLRAIILNHLGITESDINDYYNRPKTMIQSDLIMQTPQGGLASKGKEALCAEFIVLFEKAQSAFKGLADNALLKSWEFTLASFAEIKSGFTRWNLYSSLGLSANEPGGIGECLHGIIKEKFDEANLKLQDYQIGYEQAFTHIKYLETRVKRATESEGQWLKAELQSKVNEFYSMENIRDRMNKKVSRLANLFNSMMKFYDTLFPQYFQEVYDADIHDVSVGPYDDSPAGFRLISKYGRMNTSQWVRIYGPSDFVDALVGFFITTESEISSDEEMDGLQDVISEIVTAIVNHLKTKEFLESALYRMAKAHHSKIVKNPLENLDKVEKKPWVYTSGGIMQTFISCYFRREQKPTLVSRWVENPIELLVFLLDTLKQIPAKTMEEYTLNSNKSMLMESPTHAFLLKPGLYPFRDGWQSEMFTYTWIRDEYIKPVQRYIDQISLDREMMEYIINRLAERLPNSFSPIFKKTFGSFYGTMSTMEFRRFIIDKSKQDNQLKYRGRNIISSDDVDSVLYNQLPLFSLSELKDRIMKIFQTLPIDSLGSQEETLELVDSILDHTNVNIVGSQSLQNICKSILCLISSKTSFPVDYNRLISESCQKLGFSMPRPIIFADTNWVKDDFAFVVNPGTGSLELWRVDLNGGQGVPMSIWKQWINGSRQDIKWAVYQNPFEYHS